MCRGGVGIRYIPIWKWCAPIKLSAVVTAKAPKQHNEDKATSDDNGSGRDTYH
jgi:hypothetical protein